MARRARLVLFQIAGVIIGLELLFRLTLPLPDPYAGIITKYNLFLPVWSGHWLEPPFTSVFVSGPLTGVSTRSVTYSINRFGFLYDESDAYRKDKNELRIGIVGGSTVECIALQRDKRWPDRFRQALASLHGGRPITVLNMGTSGTDTRMHVAVVAQHAIKLQLDYLVFLVGANDLFRNREDFRPLVDDEGFKDFPQLFYERWLLGRSQLFRYLRLAYHALTQEDYAVEDKPYFEAALEERGKFPVDPSVRIAIPAAALDTYESHLVSLAALASSHGITPVFLTQPMLWKPAMTKEEESVDWIRGVVERSGKQVRLSSAEAARNMDALNARLMDACAKRGWKCLDLAHEVPKTLQYFYDTAHYNEAGAEFVAAKVAQFFDQELLEPSSR